MSDVIVNKVAESGIITLNLEDYYPNKDLIRVFDLKDYLFMGLILKEKDFREALKGLDFSAYQDKYVAITCSTDAIIPVWAYMLAAGYLQPFATDVHFGTEEFLHNFLFFKNIEAINVADFQDKRIVIKGCGEIAIGAFAYVEITKKLRPHVKSIMYGEPCSTVPIYKKSLGKKED